MSSASAADDIAAAEALLRLNQAAAVVGVIVTPIAAWDVRRIRRGQPSVSRCLGYFARRYPILFWGAWIGLGLHFAVELPNDPLTRLGELIRRTPVR